MTLRFSPYTLELKNPFTVAVHTRSTTPVMLVEVEQDGIIGYGEASMPPYLGENHDTARAFLSQVKLPEVPDISALENTLKAIDAISPGSNAAKAAVDIALHDWIGKRQGLAWHQIWRLDPAQTPVTSFTIGIDNTEVIRQKVMEAEPYRILKVKLGRGNDREIIRTVRGVSNKPIRVDVNQGWQHRDEALIMIEWLAERNVELVEQPMPKESVDDCAWLKERSPIPIIADEAVVRLADIRKAVGVYDGINIKLMKSTGMQEAYSMIQLARELGLQVMLGCMTETSCGISAATQLSPIADFADLDGAALISNDPFDGAKIVDGKMVMPAGSGIGAVKI